MVKRLAEFVFESSKVFLEPLRPLYEQLICDVSYLKLTQKEVLHTMRLIQGTLDALQHGHHPKVSTYRCVNGGSLGISRNLGGPRFRILE